jgi:hypothetical protein
LYDVGSRGGFLYHLASIFHGKHLPNSRVVTGGTSGRPTARSRVADWRREPATDDLLDELPPAAPAAVRQVTSAPLASLLDRYPHRSAKAALAAQSADVVRNLHAAIAPRPRAPWL